VIAASRRIVMTGFYYKPGWDRCPTCHEKLTLEVEYLGPDKTDQPAWAVLRDFCWDCEDPIPPDWEWPHDQAWEQAFPLLSDHPPTKETV
jgi:hypothetical protein